MVPIRTPRRRARLRSCACQATSKSDPLATRKLTPLPWSTLCCLPAPGRHFGFGEKAGAAFLAEPVAVATDREDVAVVEQPIEDRGRDDRIAEDGAPFARAIFLRR